MNPSDLTRRGYQAELKRHRANLGRALSSIQRAADELDRRLTAGEVQLSGVARQVLADAGDVAQAAAALETASQLDFTLDEEP